MYVYQIKNTYLVTSVFLSIFIIFFIFLPIWIGSYWHFFSCLHNQYTENDALWLSKYNRIIKHNNYNFCIIIKIKILEIFDKFWNIAFLMRVIMMTILENMLFEKKSQKFYHFYFYVFYFFELFYKYFSCLVILVLSWRRFSYFS